VEDDLMRASWRVVLAITATCASVGLASVTAGPARAVTAPAAVRPAATTYSTAGELAGVAAASNSSAWAVGYAGKSWAPRVLMLHWNGKAWSRVTSPGVLTGTGQLTAITAVSATNAWAVGYIPASGNTLSRSLLLHWNGKAWSQVTSPGPVSGGLLWAVTATAKAGWAVGYVNTSPGAPLCCAGTPLVLRLAGTKWSRVGTKLGDGAYLKGVAVTGTGTALAAGGPLAMSVGALAHVSGSTWTWDKPNPAPGLLDSIAAGPGGIAFAVGANEYTPPFPAVSLRWTGKAWQKATVSVPGMAQLSAVAFAPGGTAWAAGFYSPGSTLRPLVTRWNGTAWTRVASPGTGETLSGLAFSASGYGWAVGSTTSTSGAYKTVILHWNGRAWG
jgi:hypothetical protein